MEGTRFFLLLIITLLLVQCCSLNTLAAAQANANLTTDQSALLALKAHVTNGPQNMILANWSTSTSVCNWVGVTCGAHHLRVTVLNISYSGLTGTLPPELGNLSFLVELRLTNNSFHGPLPKELAHLRRLKLVSFGNNNFVGAIPSWFGSLSNLQTFNLYGNQFSGSIPTEIFNLSALQVVDLANNQLSGSIPREFGNLTMLREIILNYNNFREISNEIGNLDQLERLDVEFNNLEGPIPATFFNLSSLIGLDLTGNNLSGRLPDNICQHLPNIQGFYLSQNQFDGPLPSKLWQCKQLLHLSLSYNKFSGSIPRSTGNLTNIMNIYLGNNNLTGTIPEAIGRLENLQALSLFVNNLYGPIPSTIFNMSKIIIISLAINHISGSLPANMGSRLPNLEEFYVPDNNLSGLIPNLISNASKLTKIDLALNTFSGFVPTTLCASPNLQLLQLELNNLTIDTSSPKASIFSCLGELRNLRGLSLYGNPLNVPLPSSLGNLSSSLQNLDISICNMRGNIPNEIGNLTSLTFLNLEYNQLTGSIPTSMGRLGNLQGLYLNNNKLQGYIPDELCELRNLYNLFLGGNLLTGPIPSCMGNLVVALRSLSLGSNLLNSTIPSTLWGLAYILHVNLSSNFLIGSLPQDVGYLKKVIEIDLSNNHFSGIIPSSIGDLQDLVNLSLANNALSGSIPSSFGNLLSLKLLDLSKNDLSGAIPKSLEAILYLQYLNLSFNRLKGEIPTGGPFKNLSAQSFLSNVGLCGAPRLHVTLCKNSTLKPPSTKVSRSILKYIIPGIIAATLLVALVLILIQRRKRSMEVARETTLLPQLHWKRVSYQELLAATNGFNESNLLGTGGFGSVYRGTLSDGIVVAIKVFNLQLENAFKSFGIECEMLRNIRHRNLIKIISCCSQTDFKAVVVNYMPNGSLDKWLYSQNLSLNILQRLNIIIDVASALEYLHHGYEIPIVHCDVKPGNILLDDEMVAHVADFGIAKLLGGGDSITHTMTLATVGYMAPEYGIDGIVSRRGDVHGFGIVVMETFTRRKPIDTMFVGEMSLKQWVANSLPDEVLEVVDANLLGTTKDGDFMSQRDCLSSIMRLALACSADSPEDRINMQDALATLNKIKIKFLKDTAGGVVLNRPVVQHPIS